MTEIHNQQQQALQMAEAIRREGQVLKQQQLQGTVDLTWVTHYRLYVTHMQHAINQRIKNVSQIHGKLAAARQELAQAAKETKILERLKAKQKKRYDRKLSRLETIEQDEVGTNMFLRAQQSA